MSVVATIIGGAVSAILGGVAYFLIDTARTRTTLKSGLLIELQRNQKELEELAKRVNPPSNWNGRTTESFQVSAYESLRTNDPILEAHLNEHSDIIELYQDLTYLNAIREASFVRNRPIPSGRRGDFREFVKRTERLNEDVSNKLESSWYYHLLRAPIR